MDHGVGYYDRDGNEITEQAYKLLRDDPTYAVMRAFENDRIVVELRWHGRVGGGKSMFPSERKIYLLEIADKVTHDEYGNALDEPILLKSTDSDSYADLDSAVNQYEHILAQFTESEFITNSTDGRSILMEVGNKRTPPKPPSLDMPSVDPESANADLMGSW